MRKAAISVVSNISEGSDGDLLSQVYIALGLKYVSEGEFTILFEKCNEISGVLNSLIKYLCDNQFKGTKFQ
jgi:hypothetical protein